VYDDPSGVIQSVHSLTLYRKTGGRAKPHRSVQDEGRSGMSDSQDCFQAHLKMTQEAWDSYHPVWAATTRQRYPDRRNRFDEGHFDLDPLEVELIGDVRGRDVLELSCGWDASQAFGLVKLGATVTACDISPVAIEIARREAEELGVQVEFVTCDSQTLQPIGNDRFDLVFAQYNYCYYEHLARAFVNWFRVLRGGGRLFVRTFHPVTACLEEKEGTLAVTRSYFDQSPEYYKFNGTRHVPDWQSDLQAVEFPYTLSDLINGMVRAGFRMERMVETERKANGPRVSGLPEEIFMTALKPE
jgi:ubiquinone/menaquinone biosynthesis C-methylase UbiE